MGDETSILRLLICEYLFVSLFRACAESLASENASRLAAMQCADRNIDELPEDLNGTFHRIRQSCIDPELFDVVSGFDALVSRRQSKLRTASDIMKSLLQKYWDILHSSFWFLPSLMVGGAIALAMATIAVDEAATDDWLQALGWAYTGGAEGASTVLGAIAGSMITIAGVVFTMTLVALSLASSQLGPGLLRN